MQHTILLLITLSYTSALLFFMQLQAYSTTNITYFAFYATS